MCADPEKKRASATVHKAWRASTAANVNVVLLGNKACYTNVRAGCKYTSSKKVNETRYKKHNHSYI